MFEKAQKLANMTYPIIAKSCHKVLIGKTYWKNLAIPAILYGTNIIRLTNTEIKKLQQIENGVYRKILGAAKYAPNCTLRGEIGASSMKARIIKGTLTYIKGIEEGNNKILKAITRDMKLEENNKWMNTIREYLHETNLQYMDLTRMNKEELKKKINTYDTKIWEEELRNKSSLKIYEKYKPIIKEDLTYDNKPSSVILYKARTNTLPLNDRKRHMKENTECINCGYENEDIEHFILSCPAYSQERSREIQLQQPYEENKIDTIGKFLFEENGIEEKKELLYSMWRKREKMIKEHHNQS